MKNITMINVHAPTEEKEDDIKEDFYNNLEDVIEETPKQDILIMLGDFNAKIDREQTVTRFLDDNITKFLR